MTQSRLAVTGTPGTGKTTATEHADTSVTHLNDIIHESEAEFTTARDQERDSLVVDLEAVSTWLGDWDGIIESHLAHYFDVDGVVVLRCHPEELECRLRESNESAASIKENLESEALDLILSEAVHHHGKEHVWEIDTTNRSPDEVADEIMDIYNGDRSPRVGIIDFTPAL
ncbi:adenylate kinase family protein [Haloquadratum walsbyi]|uniref:Putative adenylate kinase n=1 Tax=Haloquadratum walsbyi (strain DSM 16854 / JCM 12705 / C23) TaxID=768065 RepID=G0LF57_HALWC|nr:AAA family ATPase [Haloquadratum walsbyi]CCC41620.1 probable adenylate kinase [Haloquadratum walsbyi C23]